MRRIVLVMLSIGAVASGLAWLPASAHTITTRDARHVGASARPRAGQPAAAATPEAPPEPALPTATARPVLPTSLRIASVRTYDSGQASPVLYVHHAVSFRVRYLMLGQKPRRAGYAEFSVVAHGATILQQRVQLRRNSGGVAALNLKLNMPVGAKRLSVVTHLAGKTEHRSATFLVLDPNAYLLRHGLSGLAGGASLVTSRIESDRRTLHEHYLVHLGRRTFRELGRQIGTFQVAKLVWPGIDRSQVAVQAALVSMFAGNGQARAAFWQQVAQYQIDEGCGTCKLKVRQFKVDSSLGKYARAGFQTTSYYGVTVREVLFVRGPVLIEVWTYSDGSLSHRMSGAMDRAARATAQRFDGIARTQMDS